MKKIKLIGLTTTSTLAAATPLLLTSCHHPTSDIDIKQNPNIQIDCKEIEVGKELTIKYTLTNNYGFDVAKSTITFADSNATISLLQCDVDRAARTIKVPAEYVTSKNVTIDIKAESVDSTFVTQAEYEAAMAKLETVDTNRQFKMDGYNSFYLWDEEGIKPTLIIDGDFSAKGTKEYVVETDATGGMGKGEIWVAPDTTIGNWWYQKFQEDKILRRPSTGTPISGLFKNGVFSEKSGFGRDISKFQFDPLYNAFYVVHKTQYQETYDYIKFTNKFVTFFAAYGASWTQAEQTEIYAQAYNIKYECPDITIPSEWEDSKDPNYMHNDPAKYETTSNGMKYTYNNLDNPLGRYTVPANYAWDSSKAVQMDIVADSKSNLNNARVKVAVDGAPISDDKITFNTETGHIEIAAGTISGKKEFTVLFTEDPTNDGDPYFSNPTICNFHQE